MNAMRFNPTKTFRSMIAAGTFVAALTLLPVPGLAQRAVPGPGDPFKDTSMLKPPAGVKVAVIEWQDLTCPACAHAFPIVHAAVAHYGIPLIEKDFLLPGEHTMLGNKEGAIWARYLQDKVSPKVADEYRGAVFAAQTSIESKDDMLAFTRKWFAGHGQQMPFVPDPNGQLLKEVMEDKALGDRMGLQHTPTIIVCSQREWVHVTDVSALYQTIDEVEARAGAAGPPAKPAAAKKATH
jgi:protein-disulfide isomerase